MHIRYLGVVLDHRLNLKRHIENTSEKASRVTATLSRLMPNIEDQDNKSGNC